jgi:hypothetical protein
MQLIRCALAVPAITATTALHLTRLIAERFILKCSIVHRIGITAVHSQNPNLIIYLIDKNAVNDADNI